MSLIAKSLISATYACELGMAIEYPQPGQLFTAALLYSIGDLAIAYQDPDLFEALQAISRKAKLPAECVLQETQLLGIPRLTLAQALARMWKLPDDLIELFSRPGELVMGRWPSGFPTYRGVVVGSIRLVEVMTNPAPQAAIEEAKRILLLGNGLTSAQAARRRSPAICTMVSRSFASNMRLLISATNRSRWARRSVSSMRRALSKASAT